MAWANSGQRACARPGINLGRREGVGEDEPVQMAFGRRNFRIWCWRGWQVRERERERRGKVEGVLRPGHGIEFRGVTRVNFRTQAMNCFEGATNGIQGKFGGRLGKWVRSGEFGGGDSEGDFGE